MNCSGRCWTSHAIHVYVRHYIMSSSLFFYSGVIHLLVIDVLVVAQLLNGFVTDVDAELFLSLSLLNRDHNTNQSYIFTSASHVHSYRTFISILDLSYDAVVAGINRNSPCAML